MAISNAKIEKAFIDLMRGILLNNKNIPSEIIPNVKRAEQIMSIYNKLPKLNDTDLELWYNFLLNDKKL